VVKWIQSIVNKELSLSKGLTFLFQVNALCIEGLESLKTSYDSQRDEDLAGVAAVRSALEEGLQA